MAERANNHSRECKRLSKILIPAMRERAKRLGYAIGVHGSLAYDIDLIAAPWRNECVSTPIELRDALMECCKGITGFVHLNPIEPAQKPHGRIGYTFHLGSGPYVDLSIMPTSPEQPETQPMSDLLQQRIKDDTRNCYAACIASITGIPFDELKSDVPPLSDDPDEERRLACEFNNRINRLLHQRGWRIQHMWAMIPKGVAIACVPSPRNPKMQHAVVVNDGKFYFDPHPSDAFGPYITDFEILVPILGRVPDRRVMGKPLTEFDPKWIRMREGGDVVGLTFRCPCCAPGERGSGTTFIGVMFTKPIDRDKLDIDERDWPHYMAEHPDKHFWQREGETFEDLTLAPSIDVSQIGHWHGFITKGLVK